MLVCLVSEQDDTSSGRMEQWTDGRPNGMARSSGRLTGNLNSSDLQTLNSGIHVYSIYTLKWFCPNTEWGQNTNNWELCFHHHKTFPAEGHFSIENLTHAIRLCVCVCEGFLNKVWSMLMWIKTPRFFKEETKSMLDQSKVKPYYARA
jgi:hypothetical protein